MSRLRKIILGVVMVWLAVMLAGTITFAAFKHDDGGNEVKPPPPVEGTIP